MGIFREHWDIRIRWRTRRDRNGSLSDAEPRMACDSFILWKMKESIVDFRILDTDDLVHRRFGMRAIVL